MGYTRKVFITLLLFFTLNSVLAQKPSEKSVSRPKLMVGLVVDQMRWDYLYRYYDRYGKGGFKRMLEEGFTCENTFINYIPTKTAVGHSSVYTGSVPAIHGIAGNDFIIQATGKKMYCTEDKSVQTVGSSSSAGQMSPRNLLATTVADELKLATNFRSKVIGISLKDRGGILPAGHSADAAYWFDDAIGGWISSTWYMKELPAWVQKFNAEGRAQKYLAQDWNPLYPIKTYLQSMADDSPYEGKFKGTTSSTFPIKTSELAKTNGVGTIRSTPYGNTLTFDLAKEAIANENLGADDITDFLAVSLSSPDYIGHQFTPNSTKTEDAYLRLDRDFADFFQYLDKKVGKGQYTVFLTADHGGAHNPFFLQEHKLPGDSWSTSKPLKELNEILKDKYNFEKIVLSLDNNQVHLNNILIREDKLDEAAIRKDIMEFFRYRDGVAWAVDMTEIDRAAIPAAIKERIVNGYNPERSGAITIVLKPGWIPSQGRTGSNHGHWSPYDSQIPLVWMGWGIKQGRLSRETHMTDIAPTVSTLLRVQQPSGSIGKPIIEALK